VSSPSTPQRRFIDRRGQRFGAGFSAVVLLVTLALGLVPLVPLVALALGVSAALGTRWFVFGRPWPVIRNALHLGPPDLEPEIPPRFAQALGASFLAVATLLLAFGWSLGWVFVAAVAALQTVLAVTGFCLGCRLYGLTWFVPSVFDRLVGVERPTALPRRRIERVG
jgi:hypothetical protein